VGQGPGPANDGEEGISLFPTFNILACTLGVMAFVLATIATVSLGTNKAVEFVSEAPAAERDVASVRLRGQ